MIKIKPLPPLPPGVATAVKEELTRPCYALMIGAYTRGILEHRIEPPEWAPVETGQLRSSSMRCVKFERRLLWTGPVPGGEAQA